MPSPSRPWWRPVHARWLGLVAVAQLAALWVMFRPSVPASDDWLPYTLVLRVQAASAGSVAWWWDRQAGLVTHPAARAAVEPAEQPRDVRLGFPSGEIVRGLIAFTSEELRVNTTVAVERHGEVVATFSLHEAAGDSAEIALERGHLVLRRVGDRQDGRIEIDFQPAWNLPVPQAGAPAALTRAVSRQRILALLAWTAGTGLLAAVARHRRRAATAVDPRLPAGLQRILLVFVALTLVFARRPDVFALPQFWAEDGAVFFAEHHRLGWAAVLQPYAGYLHLWPRVTAGLAAPFPVAWAPLLYLGSAVIALGLAVLRTASPRSGLRESVACALIIVLVPHAAELILNVTNAQWYGAIVLAVTAVAHAPYSRLGRGVDAALVGVFGLTGPFGVLLLPAFAWRVFAQRDRHSWLLLIVVAATAAVQVFTIVVADSEAGVEATSQVWLQLLGAVGWRTGGELTGLTSLIDIRAVPWVGVGLLALWGALCLVPATGLHERTRVMLLIAAGAVVLGGMLRFRAYPGELFLSATTQRYFALPVLVSLWLLVAGARWGGGARWRRITCVVALAVAGAHAWHGFRVAPLVAFDWAAGARAIEAGQAVSVPINPAPWAVVLEGRAEHSAGARTEP